MIKSNFLCVTAELTRQYNRQTALAEIELAINKPSELQSVLEQIVSVTTDAVQADKGVSIVLWDAEKETYTISATTVRGQEHDQTARRLRKEKGATRWILERAQPLIVPDTNSDPFGANRMIREFNIGAYIGVPLLTDKDVVGVLYTLMEQPQSIENDKIEFLTTVARRAALAITKVRLFGQAQERAAERERQRLARELHDVVSQSLFSANLIAESLPLLLERNPERAHTELKDLHLLTRAASDEMRSLLIELRPRQLIDKDFGELVRQLVNAFSSRTRIPVALQTGCEMQFPPEVQIGLYRIAQEALNNIAKHARANKAWLNVRLEDNNVVLEIRDDGRGFDQGLVEAKHMGLNIMQERADEIGATLCINSTPNNGTVITVHHRIDEDRQPYDRYEFDPNFARG